MNPAIKLLAFCPLILISPAGARETPAAFQRAIEAIEAHAPQEYPEVLTPIPELNDQRTMSPEELISLMDSWNPPLRMAVAEALARRGPAVVPDLVKATASGSRQVRMGAVTALASIMKRAGNSSQWAASGSADSKAATPYPEVADALVRLTRDEDREIRFMAAQGLRALAPQTTEAARALARLWSDEDEFVAQNAMIAFSREMDPALLPPQELVDAIRPAFKSPLPRTRGWAARIVAKMEPAYQRQLVPELIEHLKWDTMRDTMFARIGPAASLSILTELRVKEIIPLLPTLMFKRMHGDSIYMNALESIRSFGQDAAPLLPQLQRQLADVEAKGKHSDFWPRRDHEQCLALLRKTIEELSKY